MNIFIYPLFLANTKNDGPKFNLERGICNNFSKSNKNDNGKNLFIKVDLIFDTDLVSIISKPAVFNFSIT